MREYFSEVNNSTAVESSMELAGDRVQLEIPINALRRLMAGQRLRVEDMHCLNHHSHQRVRRLLLDYMMARN